MLVFWGIPRIHWPVAREASAIASFRGSLAASFGATRRLCHPRSLAGDTQYQLFIST